MIPHNLNCVCESFEKFDNFCVTNVVFQGINYKYVENQNFDIYSFLNGRWQIFWDGLMHKIQFKCIFEWLVKLNTSAL